MVILKFILTKVWDKPAWSITWWRHQMETFSALLAICAGNSPVPGDFPAQRPVTRGFDIYFDLRVNNRLSKQSWGWWFETVSRPLLRHGNEASIRHCVRLKLYDIMTHRYLDSSGGLAIDLALGHGWGMTSPKNMKCNWFSLPLNKTNPFKMNSVCKIRQLSSCLIVLVLRPKYAAIFTSNEDGYHLLKSVSIYVLNQS